MTYGVSVANDDVKIVNCSQSGFWLLLNGGPGPALSSDCGGLNCLLMSLVGSNKGEIENEQPAASTDLEVPLAPYWLPAIIESAEDAIVSKSLEGIITSWNDAAERIFGYKAHEIIGKPVLTIIPPELQHEETEILSRIRNGERIDHFETIRMRKDGTRIDVSLTVSPIKTSDGKIIGASKIARDITDQKRIERERNELLKAAEEARQQAEDANKAKDNFLALLSHELRTPLHSMRGWLSMLANGLLNDDQRGKAMDVILRGIDSQNALVEDLLDVSRIVSGKMAIAHEKISLVSVVTNAIEQLRPIVIDHKMSLTTDLDVLADEMVGDSARLQQIVNNLVSNAIKYSPPGGKIHISLTRQDNNAVIEISDTGIGIDPEMVSRIFERFEQGDSSSRRSFGGLGLGLTIARHLTELHGGSIAAHSEGLGKGAKFSVILPLSTNSNASNRPGSGALGQCSTDVRLEKTKVLIVEDDLDSLELLKVVLESSGAEVKAVDRSQKAVEELSKNRFDLMISDLGLPEMDGHDLIREVRGELGIDAEELPAIALSGYVAEDDRHRSLSNGFQLHLQKPLDISTLAGTISDLLKRQKSEKLAG